METEKRLYDLLIMVYRSPDLMIRMTGYQQRYLDDAPRQRISARAETAQNSLLESESPKDKED